MAGIIIKIHYSVVKAFNGARERRGGDGGLYQHHPIGGYSNHPTTSGHFSVSASHRGTLPGLVSQSFHQLSGATQGLKGAEGRGESCREEGIVAISPHIHSRLTSLYRKEEKAVDLIDHHHPTCESPFPGMGLRTTQGRGEGGKGRDGRECISHQGHQITNRELTGN